MKQELLRIVELEQIDPAAKERLASCADSDFKASPARYFAARRVVFIAGVDKTLQVKIAGFGESFTANQIICSNTSNPEHLEVDLANCQNVFQPAKDPEIFYVLNGETSITGLKHSDVTRDFDTKAEMLNVLPRKDPDVVEIDGKIYRQTGTVQVRGSFYVVILKG